MNQCLNTSILRKDILCCDDFAPNIGVVREEVIKGGFKTEIGPDGAKYTGISQYPIPLWFECISKFIGKPITPKLSCFRLNLAGEFPHSWVHSDDICAKFASVLYMNPPHQCKGGTAFWRHNQLNIDRLPSLAELGDKGVSYYQAMEKDWKNLGLWDQIGFVAMKWNRFITYPTNLFHSRYPFEAFGKTSEDGRLIWVCFYDVEGES